MNCKVSMSREVSRRDSLHGAGVSRRDFLGGAEAVVFAAMLNHAYAHVAPED